MQNHIDLIVRAPLFEGVPETDIQQTLEYLSARVEYFSKNEPIFNEGDEVRYAGIVLSGFAQIRVEDYNGNSSILAELPKGQMFGEALCSTETDVLPVSIYAGQDCAVLFFDCKRLVDLNQNNFKYQTLLIKNLLFAVSSKALKLRAKLSIMSKRTTREKIMAYLMAESKKKGKRQFEISLDRQQLADFLGVDRSAMSAELGRLSKENIIRTRKNHFEILKED